MGSLKRALAEQSAAQSIKNQLDRAKAFRDSLIATLKKHEESFKDGTNKISREEFEKLQDLARYHKLIK